jgi:hypothetical protein
MKLEEFEDLVDRWGEDVSRWPTPFREQGAALLRTSESAREIVESAAFLRSALSDSPPHHAPTDLVDRIVSAASVHRQPRVDTGRRLFDWGWKIVGGTPAMRPAMLLSLCFLIGAGAGLMVLPVHSNADQVDFPTLLARVVN